MKCLMHSCCTKSAHNPHMKQFPDTFLHVICTECACGADFWLMLIDVAHNPFVATCVACKLWMAMDRGSSQEQPDPAERQSPSNLYPW
jgi:hypothetical protein